MAGLVVTIAQRKGGAGKTKTSRSHGCGRVCGSLCSISTRRQPRGVVDLRRCGSVPRLSGFEFAALPDGGRHSGSRIGRAGADLVVIDVAGMPKPRRRSPCAPRGWWLIPVQPSPLDLWATAATAENGAATSAGAARRL